MSTIFPEPLALCKHQRIYGDKVFPFPYSIILLYVNAYGVGRRQVIPLAFPCSKGNKVALFWRENKAAFPGR